MPACKATKADDSACLKDRLRRLISFGRSEEGRRTPPAQGRAPMTAALVESLRRSVTRGGGEAAPLQNIRAVTPRTRMGAAAPCSRGRRNRRLVDCRNHGRELSITVPRWPSGFFPRRTKAGSSNTAYPRSFGRCRAAWRQFSRFNRRVTLRNLQRIRIMENPETPRG